MKLNDLNLSTDHGALAVAGVVGAVQAATMVINPKRLSDTLFVNPMDSRSTHAMTRIGGAMTGAAAITAIALSKKDDVAARRMALTAQGAAMLGVAAIQGMETRSERTKRNVGWACTALHGGLGAACLWRGLKKDTVA